jgi:hypothetical protein
MLMMFLAGVKSPCGLVGRSQCFEEMMCPLQGWSDELGHNQPTKKLTRSGVKCRRETTFLATSDNSCVRNALLDMVNGPWTITGWCACANGVSSWRKILTCQNREYRYWWEIIPAGNFPSWKAFWLDGFLTVGPTSVRIALAEGLHDCGRRIVPLLNYVLGCKTCSFRTWLRAADLRTGHA